MCVCVLSPVKSGGVTRRSIGRGSRGRGGVKRGQRVGEEKDQALTDLKMSLEASQKDLKELKERKASLERECVIYQSQLEVCEWL